MVFQSGCCVSRASSDFDSVQLPNFTIFFYQSFMQSVALSVHYKFTFLII
jgi:hypothetical protein